MEVSNLSSNWKRLQKTLQPKPQSPAPVLGKRKAGARESKSIKKPKHSSLGTPSAAPRSKSAPVKVPKKPSSARMGLLSSKPADENDTTPANANANAALEDIPSSQLRLAHKPSSASLQSSADVINSGIIPSAAAGKYIAIDCEMVGVGPDPQNSSMLARVSMVNFHGAQVYDSFVAPKEAVTDYRTFVSGITAELLQGARSFEQVQADVAGLMEGRVLVGHAVRHDLDALMLGHPKRDVRDTSRYKPFREYANGRTPGLKRLAKELLGIEIQAGEHSSIEDARATMMLYKREKAGFEREHVRRWGVDRRLTRPDAIDGEVMAVKKATAEQGGGNGKAGSGKKKKKRKR